MGQDDLERKLQRYFAAERAELRAPSDLWDVISPQLGEQASPAWWRRLFGGIPQGMARVYTAGAAAGAAFAVVVVGAAMYAGVIGFNGAGDSPESADTATQSSAVASTLAAAAPVPAPPAATAMAPEVAALATASAAADVPSMADSVPRSPKGLTLNASAMAQAEETPFRTEVWGLRTGARAHLFWISLPDGWRSGAPSHDGGVWAGTFTGPGVTLRFTFGERETTESLRVNIHAQASAMQRRAWDEYVIGNLAFIVAPPEDRTGDLLMTLQLPTGTLRLTGEGLSPDQQRWALGIFRSIIA